MSRCADVPMSRCADVPMGRWADGPMGRWGKWLKVWNFSTLLKTQIKKKAHRAFFYIYSIINLTEYSNGSYSST